MKWNKHLFALFLCCLGCGWAGSTSWADSLALVRNVHIEHPAPAIPYSPPPLPAAAFLPDLETSAGLVLLHRKGCITCHGFGHTSLPNGPPLDGLAHKVAPDWLRRWLEDPFAYLPASKMPQVALRPQELDDVMAFLLDQTPDLPLIPLPNLVADPYRGARLFQERACRQCHAAAGEGGTTGPALDRLGRKTSRRWLNNFLGTHAQNADRALTDQETVDLSAFLARRFAASGEVPDEFAPARPTSAAMKRGFTTAIERGCLQCHAIKRYVGPPLNAPVDAPTALQWAAAHQQRRDSVPAIALRPPERQALVQALQYADTSSTDTALPHDYWQGTVPLQGAPPQAFSFETQDLRPETCGTCHQQQWRQWQSSRHARALSSGLLGQLVDVRREDPDLVRNCLTCHAPLSEQYRDLLASTELAPDHGITCAACHVRQYRYFGPPSRSQRPSVQHFTGGHHGGAVATTAFRRSEFCAPCHQFAADGFALNGTLLQNTYQEWIQSPQARQGQTCQTCHMPQGQHLSRGIRDRQAVAQALELEVEWQWQQPNKYLRGTVRLHNRGAGHFLPTYVTPALFVHLSLVDAQGALLDSTTQTRVVQRRLPFDQSYELFDTRIPPGGSWIFTWTQEAPPLARFLNVLVEVDPDFFYRDFFAQLNMRGRAATLIQQAHAEIADSPYILFTRTFSLE